MAEYVNHLSEDLGNCPLTTVTLQATGHHTTYDRVPLVHELALETSYITQTSILKKGIGSSFPGQL